MSRLSIPASTPPREASKSTLDAVHKQLGVVPTYSVSSAAAGPPSLPLAGSRAGFENPST